MSDDIRVKRRKLNEYRDDPRNANLGSERGNRMLDDSLEQVGPGRSLVADANDYLPAGNKTKAAAERAGITEVIEVETEGDAIIVHKRRDWDLLSEQDKRARLYAYFDNRVAQISLNFDASQIAADVQAGLDMSAMFDPGELAFLIGNDVVYGEEEKSQTASEPSEDLGEVLQAKWGTAEGQLWQIPSKHGGFHRVICGDCRDSETVARLFDGVQAQIAVTSPPYAMQRKETYGGIPEDEYVQWWNAVQSVTRSILVEGGSFFVNIKPHSSEGERALYVFDLVVAMRRQWGWKFVDEHCWIRHSVPGAWKDRLRNGFEPVYQFATEGKGIFEPKRLGTKSDAVMVPGQDAVEMVSTGTYFNVTHETQAGIALPDNVFHAFGTRSGVAHSAQYPVELPYRFMMMYSNPKQIVYDPFLGSGTNIHAAEKARRISYGVELLPAHLAVLLEEWSLAGYKPEKVG